MNLYQQIIAIEPEISGQIILALKKWNPSASFVNEKLIEESWDHSTGIGIPTAQELIEAWKEYKLLESSKNQSLKNYNTFLSKAFVSEHLPSLNGSTIKLSVTIQSAILFNLRVSQVQFGISTGKINPNSDYVELFDFNNQKKTLSVNDFLSIVLPFAQVADQAYALSKQIQPEMG